MSGGPAHDAEPAPPRASARAAVVGAVAASALALMAATSDAMFFVNDGPQHLYAGVAALGIDDAREFERYVVANHPPTNRGIIDIIQALTPLVGWRAAYRCAVATAVLAWGWGFFALAAVLAPRRALVGWLGFAFALQTPIFLGLLTFVLASGLALLASAAFVSALPAPRRLAAAALGFGCAAHVHVAGAAVVGVMLALVALATLPARGARRARVVGELAVVGTWPLLVAGTVWWMSRDLGAGVNADAPLRLVDRLYALPSLFLVGGLEPWLLAGVLLVAVAIVAARPTRVARDSWALLFAGALLLGGAVLVPSSFAGWGGAGDRTIPLGFACLFLAAPVEHFVGRARIIAAVAIAALALGVHARVRDVQQHIVALHAPLLAAIDALPTAPRYWYAISARSSGPHADGIPAPLEPALHAGQLAALALGGYVEESHAVSPALHAALLRPEVVRHPSSDPFGGPYFPQLPYDEQQALALVPRIAGLASPFDGLLLYGPAPMRSVRDAFAAYGFRSLADAGGLSAFAFEPCRYALTFEGGPPQAALVWDVGPAHELYASARYSTMLDAAGAARVALATVCGDVWVRPIHGLCAGGDGVVRARGAPGDVAALRCTWAGE
ncbi:MAG: hypothetical protein A2138_16535 [Deltaproteobacteria bacterium RBG_16_71_12]|nr:MAG: hypothetical protein A2138_16535 [Deltaproteobacteria bacterium RBG_16_71_12]